MEKIIKLPCFGIIVTLTGNADPIRPDLPLPGAITSSLREDINPYIEFGSETAIAIDKYNEAINAVECMILSHACAGIDISSSKYMFGIENAVHGCVRNRSMKKQKIVKLARTAAGRDPMEIIARMTPEQRRIYVEEYQLLYPEKIKAYRRRRNQRIGWRGRLWAYFFGR